MAPIVVERKVDADGVLRLEIPAAAGRSVRVTVEDVVETAGGWLGDSERPADPPPTDPEWMNDPDYAGFVKISDLPPAEPPGEDVDPSGIGRTGFTTARWR